MIKRSVVLDGRPLQVGFKSHRKRGIGRYALNLLSAMAAECDPDSMELFFQRDLAPPPELPGLKSLTTGAAPDWIPLEVRRFLTYHRQVRRALTPAWRQGKVVHFLSHLDAPMTVGPHTVITVHDLIFQRLADLYGAPGKSGLFRAKRWLETRCLFGAARLIAVSDQTKTDLIELYGLHPDRISVIPEAADPSLAPEKEPAKIEKTVADLGLDPHEPFFLYLGGIDQRKGLDTLLDALAILRDRGLPHRLLLAGEIKGDKQYPALLEAIRRLDLLQSVFMPGYVPDDSLPALFGACRAFVFPSRYEGFGLPPLEAMACGAPVVAVRASAVPEVVGDAGLLVGPDDPAELARAMEALLTNHELAGTLREKGLKRATLFSWSRAARETWRIYEEISGAR